MNEPEGTFWERDWRDERAARLANVLEVVRHEFTTLHGGRWVDAAPHEVGHLPASVALDFGELLKTIDWAIQEARR